MSPDDYAHPQRMNIFEFLPKPGQKKEIPGGVIWCKEWQTNTSRNGLVDGTITFEFWIDAKEYREATKATVETPKLID